MIKRIFAGVLAVMLLLTAIGCGKKETTTTAGNGVYVPKDQQDGEETDLLKGKHTAVITVKGMGDITVELDADTAPITVTNFVNLAKDGFYDGLTFHRIIDGFMIQGGCPEGTGLGGSGIDIKGEFEINGIKNDIKHERGVISMARAQAYNSASSQFFIMHADAPHLDGAYAAFGHVTEGMDIVDKIAKETPVLDSNGTTAAKDQPVIESIKIK